MRYILVCVYIHTHMITICMCMYIYIYIYTCVYVVPLERNKENMTTLGAILCVWKTLNQRVQAGGHGGPRGSVANEDTPWVPV